MIAMLTRLGLVGLVLWGSLSFADDGDTHIPPARLLSADGAWCWFQDPRAVSIRGQHDRTYVQWMTRDGRLQVAAWDHDSDTVDVHTLRTNWDHDDHNVGAFVVLPDKRLMVFYARHNKHGLYCRTTSAPEDITRWEPEVTVSDTDRITYAHPVYLAAEQRFYVFWRGPSWKPTFATSEDGRSWSEPQVLIQDEGRDSQGIRPYTKVVSEGVKSIHMTFTDGHPRNEAENSVYYLRYEGGRYFKADGTLVGDRDALPIAHRQCDVVYDGRLTKVRAWVWDIALDGEGHPVIAYTRLPAENDHRYHWAQCSGSEWQDVEVTPGGGWFPQTPAGETEPEPHYSGGMALDHANPSVLYVSRPLDGVFEIEQWRTPDEGRTWQSREITSGSSSLNVRPVVSRGDTELPSRVLWMSGRYEHYTNYYTGIRVLTLDNAR